MHSNWYGLWLTIALEQRIFYASAADNYNTNIMKDMEITDLDRFLFFLQSF